MNRASYRPVNHYLSAVINRRLVHLGFLARSFSHSKGVGVYPNKRRKDAFDEALAQ
jgi:hypothetical protein